MPAEKRRFSGRLFYFNFTWREFGPATLSDHSIRKQFLKVVLKPPRHLSAQHLWHQCLLYHCLLFNYHGYFKAVTNAKITKTVASATITKRDLITGFNRHEHVASISDAESCFLVKPVSLMLLWTTAATPLRWYSMSKAFYNPPPLLIVSRGSFWSKHVDTLWSD